MRACVRVRMVCWEMGGGGGGGGKLHKDGGVGYFSLQ